MATGDATTAGHSGPIGVGGWLILPVIGLILTMIRGLMLVTGSLGLEDAADRLSDAQKGLLVGEIVGNTLIALIIPLVLLVLLQQKKRAFPRLYVVWAFLAVLFLIADLVAAKTLFGDASGEGGATLFDGETIRAIVGTSIASLVWAPYMMMSRRVRNTFVN